MNIWMKEIYSSLHLLTQVLEMKKNLMNIKKNISPTEDNISIVGRSSLGVGRSSLGVGRLLTLEDLLIKELNPPVLNTQVEYRSKTLILKFWIMWIYILLHVSLLWFCFLNYHFLFHTWPSGKLPFDCQKNYKNLTFFSKIFFVKKCQVFVHFLTVKWQFSVGSVSHIRLCFNHNQTFLSMVLGSKIFIKVFY